MTLEVAEPSVKYLATTAHQPSEVGPIPADWSVVSLHSIAKVTSGKRLPMGHFVGDRVTAHPYIRVTDMRIGTVALDDIKYVPDDAYPPITNYRIFKEDLFISVAGTLGVVGKIPDALDGANLTENADRISEIRCDRDYLMYILLSPVIQDVIESEQTVGAQPKLALARIRKFSIPLPPTATEQHAIATALSDIDALIAGLERLIAKKRDIKQAAMQQLLPGQTRLPGFSGEWEMKLLPELADIRSGGTPSTTDPAAWDGDIDWCTPTDITALSGRKYLTGTARKITAHGLKQSSAEVIPAGSIVMTSRATIGECAINVAPITTNQGFKNFIPFDNVDAEFFYYLLSTQKAGFISLCGGSTFLEIGKAQLRGYGVRLPTDKPEQTAIATVLSDMDADLAALESRLAKTRAIKQGMMQELLTGKTRLV